MRAAAALLVCILLTGCVQDIASDAASPVPSRAASVALRASDDLRREPVVDRHVQPLLPDPQVAGRPSVNVPPPHLIVVRQVQPASTGTGRTLRGVASWYDDGHGYYAAAGPLLRVGQWRGRYVRVCAGAKCIRLRLSDWCQCYWKQPNERVIDLSRDAFRKLAPLSRGIVTVTVSW